QLLAACRILRFMPGRLIAVAPVHVLDHVLAPPHAFEGATRTQGLGELHLGPRSRGVLVTALDGDCAEIAPAGHQGFAALFIFAPTLPRRRARAPGLLYSRISA